MYPIIFLGIFLILCIVGYVLYTKRGSTLSLTEKSKDTDKWLVSSVGDTRNAEKNVDHKEASYVGLHNGCSLGQEWSAVDNGCKIKEGGSCDKSCNCVPSSFCFNSICTPKPFNMPQLTIRNTPMRLEDNRFMVPKNWWSFTDISSICPRINMSSGSNMGLGSGSGSSMGKNDSLKEKEFYLVTEQGRIFRTNLSNDVNNKIEQPTTLHHIINHMFVYENKYHGIGNGFLYKLVDENAKIWSWSKIHRLYSKDIVGIQIFDGVVVDDHLILTTNEGIFDYSSNKTGNYSQAIQFPNNEDDDDLDINGLENRLDSVSKGTWVKTPYVKIAYGADKNRFIVQNESGLIEYYEIDSNSQAKKRTLSGDIIDFALSKTDPHVIYLLNKNNVCYEHIYDSNNGSEDSSVRLLGLVKRIITQNNNVWGFSTSKTFDLTI